MYRMAGNFCGVLIFVVDLAVIKFSTHEINAQDKAIQVLYIILGVTQMPTYYYRYYYKIITFHVSVF